MGEAKTRREAFEGELIVAESCATCRFGLMDGQRLGEVMCRRYPPTMIAAEVIAAPDPKKGGIVTVTSGVVGHFPVMSARDGWCGEHQIRKAVN